MSQDQFHESVRRYRDALRDAVAFADPAMKARMLLRQTDLVALERAMANARDVSALDGPMHRIWDSWNTRDQYEGFQFIAQHAFHQMHDALNALRR